MKVHRNLEIGVFTALREIFENRRYADNAISFILKNNPKWGSSDRRYIAETTYEIVRWWRLLWELAGKAPSFETEKLDQLLSVYTIWNRLRSSSANSAEKYKSDADDGTDSEQFGKVTARFKEKTKIRAIRESIPDWLDELCASELGDRWNAVLPSLNTQAPVILRANTLRTTRSKLIELLRKEGIETAPCSDAPDALRLLKRRNMFTSVHFKNGLFEVQDEASQLVAQFLQVGSGMRVIDACAGAGGKSLHIASIMRNTGKIIALDTEQWKLDELRRRAKRNGAVIIESRTIDSTKTLKRLFSSADRLLLDVPCSGLGILRRNPDTKWKLQPERIEELRKAQRDILTQYTPAVKPGGKFVYATCSILPSENEEQVEWFLHEKNGAYSLEEVKKMSPDVNGTDGFFMARFIRR